MLLHRKASGVFTARGRPARRRVALLIETSNAYARGLLRGVQRYNAEYDSWSMYLGEQRRGEPVPNWFRRWQGDGIIARLENDAIVKAALAPGCPVVDVSAARLVPNIPYVETDDDAIAAAVVDHLLERGLRHFAYCGQPEFNWSNNRQDAFLRRIRATGHEVHLFRPGQKAGVEAAWSVQQSAIQDWIQQLPKPVGVFACYDIRGRHVMDACRAAEIAVPDAVAVIAVDNDELICELADVPMSSIVPDSIGAGYEAARLLDLMMSGKSVEARAYLLPPLGLTVRRSTDMTAVDDPDVVAAARLIREHACEGLRVVDVLEPSKLSRRVLEYRFKNLLGRTVHEQIVRTQIEKVKQLLMQTDLKLPTIALRTGFKHAEYLSVSFKRQTGMSPTEYRHVHAADLSPRLRGPLGAPPRRASKTPRQLGAGP